MAQPPDYVPSFDFGDFSAANPSTPLPGANVDTELTNAATSINKINDNLALIQRDDGELANLSVGLEQLDASVSALMAVAGSTPRGAWLTGTVYAAKDVVSQGGVAYLCVTAHTAGVFATDLAAGRWLALTPTFTAFVSTLFDDVDAAAFLTTLGFSAFGQTMIDDANASAALTTLGFSAFGKTIIDDADAAAVRATIAAAASGANTDLTSVYLNNTGLKVKDTNASHGLSIVPGSDLTADRVLTLTTGDAARTIDISAASLTLSAFMATLLDDASAALGRATLGALGSTDIPKGWISGLALSRASATSFGVTVGQATNEDAGTRYAMEASSAFTKTLSAWAAGTGNGGLDTGAVAANTWYHVHMIRKDSDGSIDYLYSTSVAGPTMPGGYTARRRIGSFKTDGASQIIAFNVNADDPEEFLWDVATIDVDAVNPGVAAVTRTLNVPTGLRVLAIVSVGGFLGTTGFTVNISSLDVSDQAAQAYTTGVLTGFSDHDHGGGGTNGWGFIRMQVRTNASGQVRSRLSASGAADRLGLITRGWRDNRGRG